MKQSNILFQLLTDVLNLQKHTAIRLERLGLKTVKDLLFHLPTSFTEIKLYPNLNELTHQDNVILNLEIFEADLTNRYGKPSKVAAGNNSGQVTLIYFNKIPPFIKSRLSPGNKITIMGKVELYLNHAQISHPEIIYNPNLIKSKEPVYPLTAGISNLQMNNYIDKIFNLVGGIGDYHSTEFLAQKNWPSLLEALKILHGRKDGNIENAKQRLAYDEIFANQLTLAKARSNNRLENGKSFPKAASLQQEVLNKLGFTLTEGQAEALQEIETDQASNHRMARLLQGDVGCGKTLVALLSILNVVASNAQSALMAPTDILATQHFEFFKSALSHLPIEVRLLTGKTKAAEKRKIYDELAKGQAHIVIGTHALFQEKVEFKNLGLSIIDEQHRFGVNQRLELIEKGQGSDALVMTATPIPRSLTLTLFGDMDCSKITIKPKGRKSIITTIIPKTRLEELIFSLSKKIDEGEKIYWVCPLVEKKDEENEILDPALAGDTTDAVSRFEELNKIYPDKVSLVHGKMKSLEKDEKMLDFKSGNKNILVATTVIEVGVDVPEATLIIIENAEKFGLAQLHQLRGRVGRGDAQSYCILLYGKRTSHIGRERLKIMKESNDGFFIAEQDLLLRGGGEMLGTKQSGMQLFHFADLAHDIKLLESAREAANICLANEEKIKEELQLVTKIFDYNIFNLASTG